MFYARFHVMVKDVRIVFHDRDDFPVVTARTDILGTGGSCSVTSSNPTMMLFMLDSLVKDSCWVVEGDLIQNADRDDWDRLQIKSTCNPKLLQQGMISGKEQTHKRIDLNTEFPASEDDLRRLILGLIIFKEELNVKTFEGVNMDDRLDHFEKVLDFKYNSLEEVEADFDKYRPLFLVKIEHAPNHPRE